MTSSPSFIKPPRFKVSGLNGLASHGNNQEVPAKKYSTSENLIASHQIHRKASMLYGEIMLKEQNKSGRGKVHLFIDKSNSCFSFFKQPSDLEHLITDLCQWLTHFGWKWELHTSEPGTIAWDKTLWHKWHQSFLPQSNSIALIISDFHGQAPMGPFWKQLQSLQSTYLFWLRHPYDTKGNIDIDDPNQSHKEVPNNRLALQEQWVQQQSLIWKKLGLSVAEIHQATLPQIEAQLALFIS